MLKEISSPQDQVPDHDPDAQVACLKHVDEQTDRDGHINLEIMISNPGMVFDGTAPGNGPIDGIADPIGEH